MKSEAFPTGCHKSISLQKEKYWTADEVGTKTSKFICISETKKKKKKDSSPCPLEIIHVLQRICWEGNWQYWHVRNGLIHYKSKI